MRPAANQCSPFIPDLVEPDESQNEPYLTYYEYLLSQPNSDLPQVISNSYGEPEQVSDQVPHRSNLTLTILDRPRGLRQEGLQLDRPDGPPWYLCA